MDRSGRTRTRWSDKAILNADARTMDAEECIAMLRSRGVTVREGRVPRSELANLLRTLQNSITDVGGVAEEATPAPEGRKRSNSTRSKVKATAEEEEPARPKRKSGATAAKKSKKQPEEEEEQVEENVEEAQEEEPEKKRRRSSTKRTATKRRSSARPTKRVADSDGEEEEEQPQQQEEEQREEPAKKRKSAGTAARGKKRAAEKPIEEVVEEQQEQEVREEEDKAKKPAKRGRRSSVSKPKKKNTAEEEQQQTEQQQRMDVVEEEVVTTSRRRSSVKRTEEPVQTENAVVDSAAKNPLWNVVSRIKAVSIFKMFSRSEPSEAAPLEPVPVEKAKTTHSKPVEEETVIDNAEVPAPRKRIVVTPKLEIIAMSIGVALLLVFVSLSIWMKMRQSGVPGSTQQDGNVLKRVNILVHRLLSGLNWNYCQYKKQFGDNALDKLVESSGKEIHGTARVTDNTVSITLDNVKEYLAKHEGDFDGHKLDDIVDEALKDENRFPRIHVDGDTLYADDCSYELFSRDGLSYACSVLCFPMLILFIIALLGVGVYFATVFIKRYLNSLTSTEDLKKMYINILKEQAIASDGQAKAMASVDTDSPVMKPFIAVTELKEQVLSQVPEKERSNPVVRFRMYMACRSLYNDKQIRAGSETKDNKPVKTLKWIGSLDD